MKFLLHRFLTISSSDPDDTRRRRILNILLVGVGALSLLILVIVSFFASDFSRDSVRSVVMASTATFLATLIIYIVNIFWSGRVAAVIFLVFLTIIFAFSDTPQQVSDGRSLFAFVLPITMASILLAPWSSFIFSSLSGIVISIVAISIDHAPNLPAITGFFVIALVSWLSARSLEQALNELRGI